MFSKLKPSQRHPITVSTVAISDDGSRYLWAGGIPGTKCVVTVYDTASNKVLHSLDAHKKPIIRARFLKDNSVISFSFDSHVCWWDAAGKLTASNKTRKDYRADGFAISRQGAWAIIGDYRAGLTGWSWKASKSFTKKENSSKRQIWALAMDASGKRFLSGGAEGVVRVWDLAKRRVESKIEFGIGQHIQGLAWRPDGKFFAAAIAPDGSAPKDAKSRIAVVDSSKAKEVASLSTDGQQPFCCEYSPHGKLLAAAGGGTDRGGNESKANCVIHVWDVKSGERVADLAGHTGLVRDLAFSPDSRWLLSAGWDDTVRVWKLP